MSFQSIFETTVTKLKPRPGSKLYDIATAAVVYSETGEVSFEYNGIEVIVSATDTAADVIENYIKALSSKITINNMGLGVNDFNKRSPSSTWPRVSDSPYTMNLGDNWSLLNSSLTNKDCSDSSNPATRDLSKFFEAIAREQH